MVQICRFPPPLRQILKHDRGILGKRTVIVCIVSKKIYNKCHKDITLSRVIKVFKIAKSKTLRRAKSSHQLKVDQEMNTYFKGNMLVSGISRLWGCSGFTNWKQAIRLRIQRCVHYHAWLHWFLKIDMKWKKWRIIKKKNPCLSKRSLHCFTVVTETTSDELGSFVLRKT